MKYLVTTYDMVEQMKVVDQFDKLDEAAKVMNELKEADPEGDYRLFHEIGRAG